jgi:hypothetical protein
MTWDEWTGIVLWLNASYPDQKVEAATAEVWFEDLELEETGVVTVALRRCRRTSSYRPQLSSILEVCKEVRTERAAARPALSDATRRCGSCATSLVIGWQSKVEDDLEVWIPCPSCRSAQHAAWLERVQKRVSR